MNFVRQSKFRHVFCKPMKRDYCIDEVRITKIMQDSLFCAVNSKFLAVITEGAGGPFMVIPLYKVGKIDKDFPTVDAHKAPCLEVLWCPFNENVIASCSEDCSAKVWHIPDGGLVKSLKEPIVELLGHQKRVTSILWHPVASNVLLTAGADCKIFLWNVGTGDPLIEIAGHPDLIWSVSFNYNGSKIVTTCKDKNIRVIDPRSGRILHQGLGHEGVKPQRAIFVRDGRLFTTGFSKRSERLYALRDENAIDEPLVSEELDTSNGVLFPVYDYDTGMLYLAGKGDSKKYRQKPQRGLCFMPKRGLNISENEIARVYKVLNKGLVDVLQFFVPRKVFKRTCLLVNRHLLPTQVQSELFQDDLYPDTPGLTPALSADDWMNGKDADPILVPLRADKDVTKSEKSKMSCGKKANILAQITPAVQQQPQPTLSEPEMCEPMIIKVQQEPAVAATPPQVATAAASQRSAVERNRSLRDGDVGSKERDVPTKSESRSTAPASRETSMRSAHKESVATSAVRRTSRDSLASSASDVQSCGRQLQHASVDSSVSANTTSSAHFSGSTSKCAESLVSSSGQSLSVDDLLADIKNLKLLVKRLDRRVRYLEDQLHEKDIDLGD